MRKKYRGIGIAPQVISVFIQRVSEERQIDYFVVRISSNNAHSRHVFEKIGAKIIGEEESEIQKFKNLLGKYFNDEYVKEISDSCQKNFNVREDMKEVVYRYKLVPREK